MIRTAPDREYGIYKLSPRIGMPVDRNSQTLKGGLSKRYRITYPGMIDIHFDINSEKNAGKL
jgi:hypothetical protein